MSRTENLVRVVSYLALIAGIPATLVLGWILFVPGEAVCDGATMSPGQTCGLPFADGNSYEQMVTETTVRRALAYVAVGLAALGIVGVAGIETYRHKQGPAPEWFTPETTLCLAPGLMEALIPGKDESYGCTEEVPRGASGASDPDGGGSAEGPGHEAWSVTSGG